MMKSIIWKEWREQRWKLAFGTVMLVFFTGSMLAARLTTDREIIVVVWIFGGMILSLYSAMGVFAPETTAGTKVFLTSKPIPPWKVFCCKWSFGWLNFALPMLICSVALLMRGLFRPDGNLFGHERIIKGTFLAVGYGTMLYSLTCCLAPRKSGEALVGFVGLIVLVAIFMHMLIIQATIFHGLQHGGRIGALGEMMVCINPVSLMHLMNPMPGISRYSILLVEQAALFAVVIAIGLRKWQRSS